ncbi:Cof-type HAD-IIB family hydrolase [uncultured Cetobacterium sp.]|uniref:Cof-type HAD-IIB family hydrolase n=1 Tax=uncultured Cetobacterium sp. TaxID=527638 RepID=UPI00260CBE2F|nr:Cof-type HAD-IIB family hydrolase [uncultured Cetobacterium sp.]
MIKAIALDLDGTLLNSKKELSEENKKILYKFYKKKCEIIIVTGRSYNATKLVVEELGFPLTAICYNGAKIIDTEKEDVIFEKPLDEHIVKKLIKLSRETKIHLNLYQDEKWYVENIKNWQTDYYKKATKLSPEEKDFCTFETYLMTKALFIDENVELKKLEKLIKEYLKLDVYLAFSQERYLEVLDKEVNKGLALEKILKSKGVSLDECIAFGDAGNDMEMISMVKYGVAMGNASQELKDKASYITDINDENGVAKFLEKFL